MFKMHNVVELLRLYFVVPIPGQFDPQTGPSMHSYSPGIIEWCGRLGGMTGTIADYIQMVPSGSWPHYYAYTS